MAAKRTDTLDRDAAGPDRRTSLPRALAVAVLLLALAAIALVVPALPAGLAGLGHVAGITDRADAENGTLTVADCTRGALHFNWTCTGHFEVNDPEAQHYPAQNGVTLVGDPRFHASGRSLDVSLPRGTHHAYRQGGVQELRVIALWLGLLLSLWTVGLLLAAQWPRAGGPPASRRPRTKRHLVFPLLAGLAFVAIAHPFLADAAAQPTGPLPLPAQTAQP